MNRYVGPVHSMSIPNVQLAFQGGGAKFAAMLPVADAFVTAQASGDVKIKAVAGTSAGAICAALVACGADFSKVRSFLSNQGEQWVSQLIPPEVMPLAERNAELSWWEWLAYRKLLVSVLWQGNPVLSAQALSDFLQALFKGSCVPGIKKIEKCSSALTIIASNVSASKAVVHQSGDLIPALVDSCALPVIFRSFKTLSRSHNVDGGLCDNLPVEGLLADVESPVFAIYPVVPDDQSTPKNNIVTYILSLLSASINHCVLRSQAMIAEPFRFELETDLGLLEFRRAVEFLRNDDWYSQRKQEAAARIQDFLNTFPGVTPSAARVIDVIDVSQYRKSLTELSNGYADHFQPLLSCFMARVNCERIFAVEADAGRREADTVTRITKVRVLTDDVRFYRSNLMMSPKGGIVPTVWTVRNLSTDKDVPIRALALDDRIVGERKAKHCLIQFIDPKTHIHKDDILEIRGIYPTAAPWDLSLLNYKKGDFIGLKNVESPTIERAEVVLIYPKRLGALQLSAHLTRSTRPDLTPITYHREYRLALGEKFEVVGAFVNDLKLGESVVAQVTQVN
jgi:predicted acylesterase/phospholipase RssA